MKQTNKQRYISRIYTDRHTSISEIDTRLFKQCKNAQVKGNII
jgi:hypothetical protein